MLRRLSDSAVYGCFNRGVAARRRVVAGGSTTATRKSRLGSCRRGRHHRHRAARRGAAAGRADLDHRVQPAAARQPQHRQRDRISRPTRRRCRPTAISAPTIRASRSAASCRMPAPRRRSASISPTSSRRAGLDAGTQAGDGAGPGDFFDLQNVQVLKGPQGTLQGRNTTGGAVLFVPQKPTSQARGLCRGQLRQLRHEAHPGRCSTCRSATSRASASRRSRAARRLAAQHRPASARSDFNDIDYTAVRASLVVDLTPDLENYTIASYSRSRHQRQRPEADRLQQHRRERDRLHRSRLPGRRRQFPRPARPAASSRARRRRVPASTTSSRRSRTRSRDRAVAGHQHDDLARLRHADDQEHRQLRPVHRQAALAAVRHQLPGERPAAALSAAVLRAACRRSSPTSTRRRLHRRSVHLHRGTAGPGLGAGREADLSGRRLFRDRASRSARSGSTSNQVLACSDVSHAANAPISIGAGVRRRPGRRAQRHQQRAPVSATSASTRRRTMRSPTS